jgi:hypothetical protein
MCDNVKHSERRDGGYSLVEITLSLLVAAVGVLTVFGLFPSGLQSSRNAVEATEVAAFADYVFEELEEAVAYLPWDDIGSGLALFKHQAVDWGETDPVTVGEIGVFIWYPPGNRYGEDRLRVGSDLVVRRYELAAFTYDLEVENVVEGGQTFDNLKYARLEVWRGDVASEVGDASYPKGTVFYRQYTPPE